MKWVCFRREGGLNSLGLTTSREEYAFRVHSEWLCSREIESQEVK